MQRRLSVLICVVAIATMLVFTGHTAYLKWQDWRRGSHSGWVQTRGNVDLNITSDTALKVADIIARAVYPDIDLNKYVPNVRYSHEANEWVVAFFPVRDDEDPIILGGGGPQIHIRKETLEITRVGLQR